ncbi:MAG TPA: NAD(P)-dependent oxidoreductase [Xanthobacteraceae bacterium]|jgi:D-2-hydroxyacid dehydrogenase (NADP+)|nr:NAD(P)-dependent oxidoreductase [Xanthobacteraceae bacterium]
MKHVKVVYFDSFGRRPSLGRAFKIFPEVAFVSATDTVSLTEGLDSAEVLLIGNRAYSQEVAAILNRHGRALKWIQFMSSGIDNARAHGIPPGVIVTNAAGLRAGTVSEHAFALMLGVARRLAEAEHAKARQDWCRDAMTPRVISLTGKHMLIVGLGAVGQELARKAKAFDMRVTGISRSAAPLPHVDRIRPRAELSAACAEADVIVVSATYDPAEGALLTKAAIDSIGPHGIVINIARGPLVDEGALTAAVAEGRIAGAGLDVSVLEPLPPDHKLWTTKNILLTPHIGGAGADESGLALHTMLAENMRRWLAAEPLKNIMIAATDSGTAI